PFYENYAPDALLTGAMPVWVNLHWPDWHIDPDELRKAFSPRTKAIILNTPNNPTGKVFQRDELELIAGLCRDHNVLVFSDEIYEHIQFTP
ncbi:aminotransferase class I/II-fold pyridoxal phosphate-dependent enzyme, partial [Salmonella enterica]|uniref:aminotransferase class I/II-fold pyridoxal phosphate-dependent enzyme n=1 Tax=Salmonella enterica TaxID=28901 RepID=UPI003D2C9A46